MHKIKNEAKQNVLEQQQQQQQPRRIENTTTNHHLTWDGESHENVNTKDYVTATSKVDAAFVPELDNTKNFGSNSPILYIENPGKEVPLAISIQDSPKISSANKEKNSLVGFPIHCPVVIYLYEHEQTKSIE